jgi:hypothetical protein
MSALDSLGIASLTILAYLWWRGLRFHTVFTLP